MEEDPKLMADYLNNTYTPPYVFTENQVNILKNMNTFRSLTYLANAPYIDINNRLELWDQALAIDPNATCNYIEWFRYINVYARTYEKALNYGQKIIASNYYSNNNLFWFDKTMATAYEFAGDKVNGLIHSLRARRKQGIPSYEVIKSVDPKVVKLVKEEIKKDEYFALISSFIDEIGELEDKIKVLEKENYELSHIPGGPEYKKAKEEFTKLNNKID